VGDQESLCWNQRRRRRQPQKQLSVCFLPVRSWQRPYQVPLIRLQRAETAAVPATNVSSRKTVEKPPKYQYALERVVPDFIKPELRVKCVHNKCAKQLQNASHSAEFSKPQRLYSSDAHPEMASTVQRQTSVGSQRTALTCILWWSAPVRGIQRNQGCSPARTGMSWGEANTSLRFSSFGTCEAHE